ncbi:MAG TPA: DUF4230 domain-containing protein, partial [Candidatus Absconditabacterales bacterium]|nr:DUF4230 domain-containing protein [Candidatus Absconditabacterales bacterium]
MGNPEYSKGIETKPPKTQKEKEIVDVEKKFFSDIKKLGEDFLSEKAKDPDVKRATEKILGKELQGTILNNLVINQEVFTGKKVSQYTSNILKKNPELRSFMVQLGIGSLVDKKYEQLAPSQKLMLIALEDTLHGKTWNIAKIDTYTNDNGKIDIAKFQKTYMFKMNDILSHIQDGVLISQAANFGRIKTTLKEEYKLTEVETTKYLAYLEAVKNQPKAYQEAGAMGLAIYGGLMLAVGALLGIGIYKFFTDKSASETLINGRMELGTPEFVSQLRVQEVPFNATGVVEKAQFKENANGNEIMNMFKKALNIAQTRRVVMEVNGKVGIEYDLMKSKISYDPETGTLYARLENPKTIVKESSSKIIDDNTQIWQTKDFTNLPIQLQDSLTNDAKNKVQNNPNLMQQADRNVAKVLSDIYGWGLSFGN